MLSYTSSLKGYDTVCFWRVHQESSVTVVHTGPSVAVNAYTLDCNAVPKYIYI